MKLYQNEISSATYRYWVREGLSAVEKLIAARRTGDFVVGNAPAVADVFLFPQAINAERIALRLEEWTTIVAVVARLRQIPAFADNAPAPRT